MPPSIRSPAGSGGQGLVLTFRDQSRSILRAGRRGGRARRGRQCGSSEFRGLGDARSCITSSTVGWSVMGVFRVPGVAGGHGHGTFFRNLGAVLGYHPPAGSLLGKATHETSRFALIHSTMAVASETSFGQEGRKP